MTWNPSSELQALIARAKACHEAYLELNLAIARDAVQGRNESGRSLKARALAADSWKLDAEAETMFRREALGRDA